MWLAVVTTFFLLHFLCNFTFHHCYWNMVNSFQGSIELCLHRSSNPGLTHFSSRESTNGCGLSQSGLQSGLGAFTLEVNLGVECGLEPSCERGLRESRLNPG